MRSKKAFTIASAVALAGGVTAVSTDVEAACPGPTPAANTIVYKDSAAPKNACTAADVKAFNDEFAKDTSTVATMQAAVAKSSAGCASCLFAKDTDATWAQFMTTAGGDLYNDSACLQNAPGGSAACGKAYYQFGECVGIVCSDANCTKDSQAQKDCATTKNAQGNPGPGVVNCLKAFDFVTACGGQTGLQALATACGFSDPNYDKAIMVSCQSGGGGTDGGTDGGSSSGSTSSSSSSSSSSGASGSSSSGTSGSSGKSSTSSSGNANPDDTGTTSSSSSGCTTTGANDNGSMVAALAVIGAGIIGVSRRRKKDEKDEKRA